MTKRILKLVLLCTFGSFLFVSSPSEFKSTDLYRDQVAVLMYHHISDDMQGSSTITPKLFKQQLAYLKSKGYQFISLREFEHFLEGGPVPGNAVFVTFDDGYESFSQKAVPILKRMSIPSVNFIITGTLEDPLNGSIRFMNRQEAESLAQSPKIELQCHTHRLHGKMGNNAGGKALLVGRLKTNELEETDEAYNKRISDDTKACIATLESLSGKSADALAYPYGIFDEKAAGLLQAAGIHYAFTVLPKMTTRDTPHMKIPRINAGGPYITPEVLHNSIVRRVAKVKHPYDSVSLRDTVEQIGGEVQGTGDGKIEVYYNGAECKLKSGSIEAEQNGKALTLDKVVKVRFGRSYIAISDLEKLLKVKIYLDPVTNTFTTTLPDSSGVDAEYKK